MDDFDDELFALAGGDEEADVEEGEASSVAASSPNSLGSGAMDESDSDREEPDVPDRDQDVPYPVDGKYIDAKDRNYINGLSVLERERILGERAEEMSRAKFAADLKNKVNALAGGKRKASSIEPEDSQRKSSRQKVKVKTNDKLEAYKREREQRGQQRQRHDDRRNGRRRSSSADRHDGSDVDAEGESEVEWDDHRQQAAAREEPPAALNHFESVRVSRGFFGKVCFYPGFEEAMTGAFARIGTGQDAQRRTLYKMAQIKGFNTGKPYVFEGKNNARIATDQYVLAQHGSVKKEYTFSYLSNQGFTESDLETYKQSLSETSAKVPTQSFLKRKFEDIRNLENHVWTDADIGEKLKKQRKYEELLYSNRTSLVTPKIQAPSASEEAAKRLFELNKINRKNDSDRIRKALIEERRQEQRARQRATEEAKKKAAEDAARKSIEEEKKANGTLKVPSIDDLFEGSDRSRSATPATISRVGTPKLGERAQKKGLPTFRKPKMEDDVIASIDFGVDIEI